MFRGKSDKKFQNQHSGNDKHVIDNGSIERITVSQSVYVCLLWVNALMKTTHLLRSGYFLFISNNSTLHAIYFSLCPYFFFFFYSNVKNIKSVRLLISSLDYNYFRTYTMTNLNGNRIPHK